MSTTHSALDELLDVLGIEAVRVLTPTADLKVMVETVVITEPELLDDVGRGAFVLIPGLPADREAIRSALERVARAGGVAVAIREQVWRSATGALGLVDPSPAVVGVPDRLGWAELYELLTAVLVTSWRVRTPATGPPAAQLLAFADAVAVALGGAVSIEGPQGEMIAYSNVEGQVIDHVREEVILARRVPLTEQNRAEYLELSRTRGPVQFQAARDELPRLAIAVRGGDQILGFLWVITENASEETEDRLRDAARMVAVHLARARAIEDVNRRVRDDALRQLLDGGRARGLLAAGGLKPAPVVGVLAARRLFQEVQEGDLASGWIADFVALAARVRFPESRTVTVGDVVYVVAPMATPRTEDLTAVGASILARSEQRAEFQVGIGLASGVENLGQARHDADRALAALALRGTARGVATLDQAWSGAVLAQLADGNSAALLVGPISRMLDPTSETPDWCFPTLRAYFACEGNISAASHSLNLHANTLRYRVQRVREMFGLDLNDPDVRLVLSLQLRLLEVTGSP